MKIKPAKNQDIIDVCLQHFGTYEGCVDVADDNGLALDHRFDGTEEIEIAEPVAGEVKRRLKGISITPVSGDIEKGDFNNDYNNDYN